MSRSSGHGTCRWEAEATKPSRGAGARQIADQCLGETVEKRHDVGVLVRLPAGQEVAQSLPPRRRQTAAHVQPERSEPQFSKLVLLNDLAIKELRQRSFEFPERNSQIGAQRIQRRRPAFAEARKHPQLRRGEIELGAVCNVGIETPAVLASQKHRNDAFKLLERRGIARHGDALALSGGRCHAAQWHFAQQQSDGTGGCGDNRGDEEHRPQRSHQRSDIGRPNVRRQSCKSGRIGRGGYCGARRDRRA